MPSDGDRGDFHKSDGDVEHDSGDAAAAGAGLVAELFHQPMARRRRLFFGPARPEIVRFGTFDRRFGPGRATGSFGRSERGEANYSRLHFIAGRIAKGLRRFKKKFNFFFVKNLFKFFS